MKRYLLFCQLALLYSFQSLAQFTVGTDGFHVSAGSNVAINGLTFNPTTTLSIVERTLTISPTALPGVPPSVARVYTFDQPITFAGRLGQFYLPSELNGNTESSLEVVHKNVITVTTSGSVVNVTTNYIYNDLATPITFSAVTAAQPNALPVTLVDFVARKEGNVVNLKWFTTYETNSDYFDLEHSADAKNWALLSRITSASSSSSLLSYGFTHDDPATGINYYRLKMVDMDLSFAYSKIRELKFENETRATLYPNPVVDKVHIDTDDWKNVISVKLVNSEGISFFESAGHLTSKEIDMKGLATGLYVIQIKRTDGRVNSLKVIKQ